VELRAPERLVCIDVANPGNRRLGQEERLQRRRPSRCQLQQPLRGEVGGERLDPEALGEVALQGVALVEDHRLAKAAEVGEDQLAAVVELEPGAGVLELGGRLVQAGAPKRLDLHQVGDRSLVGLAKEQVPGHPQVDRQGSAAVEPDQQVFPSPLDRFDPPPAHGPLHRLRRLRPGEALVEDRGVLDPTPDQLGLELAANRLNLGQLRHPDQASRGAAPSGGRATCRD
jgi:hypothetical protein